MIAPARLDNIIMVEPLDGPLPDEAADAIARWLLSIVDRKAEAARQAQQQEGADDASNL
jgi:hypothetical protein